MRITLYFVCLSVSLLAKPLDVKLNCRSAILMNADTGAVLFEKEPHIRVYPGSITKIATALFILEQQVDLKQVATVSEEALKGRPAENRDQLPAYWLDSDGTMLGLRKGENLSLETLLHGLILISGNDAANVMAESIGGSVPRFVEMMNQSMQKYGCKNTQFRNPHGLPHPEHFSTAYDMALITKKALAFPEFRKVVSTLSYMKPKSNKQPPREIKLSNPMLNPKSRYYYSKAIGGKTGYTNNQPTLVAVAAHEGRTLIAVILGSENKNQRFEEAKRLFEAAFKEEKKMRRLLGPESVFEREIAGGRSVLHAALMEELSIEYFPSEEPEFKAAIHWLPDSLPIRRGQKVGEVCIQDANGVFLNREDLIALEDVKETLLYRVKRKLFR